MAIYSRTHANAHQSAPTGTRVHAHIRVLFLLNTVICTTCCTGETGGLVALCEIHRNPRAHSGETDYNAVAFLSMSQGGGGGGVLGRLLNAGFQTRTF